MIRPVGRFALAKVIDAVYIIGGAGQSGVTGAVQVYRPEAMPGNRALPSRRRVEYWRRSGGWIIYVPGGLDADGRALDVLEILDPAIGPVAHGAVAASHSLLVCYRLRRYGVLPVWRLGRHELRRQRYFL